MALIFYQYRFKKWIQVKRTSSQKQSMKKIVNLKTDGTPNLGV